VRDLQASGTVSTRRAFADAHAIISLETHLHLFVEHGIQHAALHFVPAIDAANLFYGTAHFIVTAAALIWLFRRHPQRYQRWRTTLAVTTGAALIGFAAYPVMPPRLLPARYGFVDTLAQYKTLWSFDSGTMQHVSNQFAAMPSLHFAWAMWVTVALVPVLRRPRARLLAIAYPIVTALVVVTTANHYLADLAGGLGALTLGLTAPALVASARHKLTNYARPEPAITSAAPRDAEVRQRYSAF